MSKSFDSKRLGFCVRLTFFMVIVVVGLYFVIDPATPKLLKLLSALGVLGIILYFFLGGGGGKGGPLSGGTSRYSVHH
jgi:hypothetical protein